jgi:hypothetical protein
LKFKKIKKAFLAFTSWSCSAQSPLAASNFFLVPFRITLLAASASPFSYGCMTDINLVWIPRILQKSTTVELANPVLLSDTMHGGRPKLHIIFLQ